MKKFLEVVVGGAIGAIALYAVAHIAYDVGHKMGEAECHYNELKRKTRVLEARKDSENQGGEIVSGSDVSIESEEKTSKFSFGVGLRTKIGGKASVIGRFVKNPEGHKIEASVEGDEIHVRVKQKAA